MVKEINVLVAVSNWLKHSASLNKKESYDPVDAGTTPAIIFLCILMAIGTIANGHVFGIFLFRYNRKSTYVTFVLALALIDLVVCVCDIPLEILDLMYPYDFYSETGCKLFKLMSATLSLSSIFTLALLSRERFKRVCYPLKPQWTNTMCRRYIAGGMVLSFLISAPVLYVHGLRRVKVADDSFVHTCFFDDDADEDWNPPLNIAEERRFTSSEKDNKSSPVRQEMAGIQLVSTGKNPPRNSHRSTIIPFIITAIFIVVFLPYLILGVFLCLKENFKANMTTTELSLYRLAMRLIFVNNVVNCFVYEIVTLGPKLEPKAGFKV
uniref:Vasopressin V1a receptor n=1 Tax=Magallana gigas TaxID=29159 RepID=K1RJV8_MAGGI